jgi:hypothetical protein
MRPVGAAALNRLVRYEPRVSPAMPVPSRSMVPSGDVALSALRHAKGQAVQRDVASLGQVKDVFVTIVQKPLRIDGLVVTALNQLSVPVRRRDGDGLNPVECVLKGAPRRRRDNPLGSTNFGGVSRSEDLNL